VVQATRPSPNGLSLRHEVCIARLCAGQCSALARGTRSVRHGGATAPEAMIEPALETRSASVFSVTADSRGPEALGDYPALRADGLSRCASSHCQRPSASPSRAAILHADSPPPSALAGAQGGAGLRPAASPLRSPMLRSRPRLHRRVERLGQAGGAGEADDSAPFPCPAIACLVSFTGT
jgi:hypothetical protein